MAIDEGLVQVFVLHSNDNESIVLTLDLLIEIFEKHPTAADIIEEEGEYDTVYNLVNHPNQKISNSAAMLIDNALYNGLEEEDEDE